MCDQNGQFSTPAPNRADCLEGWIDDIEDQIVNDAIPSIDTSEELEEKLQNEYGDLSSNGLVELASILARLLDKRRGEVNSGLGENDTEEFFRSFLTNQDLLVSFDKSWVNLEPNSGYNTTNVLLSNIIDAADLHLNSSKNGSFVFLNGSSITTQTFYLTENVENINFTTENATISIPKGQSLPIKAVGTAYNFKDATNRFPKNLSGSDDGAILDLLTTTMDFTFFSELSLTGSEKVTIEFASPNIDSSVAEEIYCVFWDMNTKLWSQDGCSLKSNEGNVTICECNHLTNFGLLFGGSSKGDEKNEAKSRLSNILGGISIACLLCTQLFKHFGE